MGGQDPDSWAPWLKVARNPPLPAQGITSGPAVASSGTGDYDVLVQGGNNDVWHVQYDGTAWSGWVSLGGPAAAGPAAATVGGVLDVFAQRADGTIWSRPVQGGGWGTLGGFAQYGVGALAGNVFIAGTNGFLQYNWWEGAGWHGWEATSGLTLPIASNFDAEWTWIGSYATWRAAIMVFLYPELLLDGTLRDPAQQTPGFQTLVRNLQQDSPLTTAQVQRLACEYDTYFRDVCSIDVQTSCNVWSRLDDGNNCASAGSVERGWLLDMFGIAANSSTAYWSTYNNQDMSGYPQTFWEVVPGLQTFTLVALCGSTSFWTAGKRHVLPFFIATQSSGQYLCFTRYDPEIPGLAGWEGTIYQPAWPADWTAFTAQLGVQNGEGDPPQVVITLPDGTHYLRQLNPEGTDWSDIGWVQAGVWQPWTAAVAANAYSPLLLTPASDSIVSAVSRDADQVDLFWVDNNTSTVQSAFSNATVNGGKFSSPFTIDATFSAASLVTAVARSADHLDVFTASGNGPYNDGNGISWNWWDANLDNAQWHNFEALPDITPTSWTGAIVAAVATGGHRVDVFGYSVANPQSDDRTIVWTWRSDANAADDQWHPWVPVGGPLALTGDPCAIARDDSHIHLIVYDSQAGIRHNFLDTATGNWQPQWSTTISNVTAPSPLTAVAPTADKIWVFADGPYYGIGDFSAADAGVWSAFGLIPNAAGAQIVAGLNSTTLSRRPTRVDAFCRGSSSVYGTSSDFSVNAGAWQPWTPISDSSMIPATSSIIVSDVTAVSRSPGRIDLFAPGGLQDPSQPEGSASLYTTYWQDIDWIAPQVELPPFSPVPIVTATMPLDIPDHLAASDLQQRRGAIQAAFEANMTVPPGFTEAAPASTMTYLREAYYFVPMYLANQLQQQQGEFTAALDWYRTVYDYSVPEQVRDIYYGLVLDAQQASVYTLPSEWLSDPLNPHAIAQTRRYAYTRYTVLQIVQCMFAYADSLFTTDTSEDDAQARTLYMTGLELLSLAIFSQSADPCAGLTIQVLDTPVDNPAWAGLLPQLAGSMTAIDSPAVLATLVPQVIQALGGKAAWPDRFAAAQALITQSRAAQPAAPTVGGVLTIRDTTTAAAYAALLATPAVDQAASTAAATAGAMISISATSAAAAQSFANGPATAPEGNTTGPARVDAKPAPADAKTDPAVARSDLVRGTLPPPSLLPPATNYQPAVDFWFCAPANPLISSLQSHAELCLYELRNGMNIAGMTRQLDPYSAPTDASSGLPAIGAGGQIVVSAAVTQQPTAYPYATLIQRAQQLVQVAAQMEAQMLAALQQYQQAAYAELQARQNLTVASATVQLQTLTVQQAADSVTLAQLQQQSAQMQSSYWQMLQSSDIGSQEQSAITAMQTQKDLQIGAAVDSDAAGVVESIISLGADSDSALAAGLTSAAGIAATSAQIDNAQASLEAQQDNWQFQYNLSQENVQITGQQITIAMDQAQAAGQQLAIANLQASNATDTLNFLVNQFLSPPLYGWMAGVLQGVYSYFLQQATAVALLAEKQMAFERQVALPGFIKSSYWQPASANLTAALTPGTSNTMGLTGAERLNQDITELDQYYFSSNQRKLQLTKTISLAQLYPVGFQQLRETGVINFSTPLSLFDQDFPGHYLRLIQQVSVSVIALIPPGQGIKATLSSSGTSQVVTGPDPFQTAVVRTDPQSVAITTPVNATGLFSTDPQSGLLLPFQELGVATQWQFSMPLAANQFDFSTLADVQVTFNYTALPDPGYRAQVIQSLGGQVSQERPYSFANDLPDQWYDLNNPAQTSTPMTVSFDVAATDFPANLSDIRIQQVILYFALAPRATFEVSVSSLKFFEAGSAAAVGGAATSVNGVISTRSGNAASWIPMIGKSPLGTWQLTLPDTQAVRDWFTGGQITDILLDITYTAATPPWPA